MADLDEVLRGAVERGDMPFAVGMVADAAGVVWQGAIGEAAPGVDAGPDTLFAIYSMTKAVAGLAAALLIERGQLSLDTEVAELVPRFDELPVLDGWTPDHQVSRPARRRATVRHLLTHTSGLAYPSFDEKMMAFKNTDPSYVDITTGRLDALYGPLMFDPGDRWTYGTGCDWIGYLVQIVDGRSVDVFCQQEIFDPLGMTGATFDPARSPLPLAVTHLRTPEGAMVPVPSRLPDRPELYGLGMSLYCTAPDYLRLLRLILGRGELEGVRILGDRGRALLTENLIGDLRVPVLPSYSPSCRPIAYLHDRTDMTHTAGFVRTERDVPGRRAAGSLWWAGFPNCFYWVDPVSDVAALLMTQLLPLADERFMAVWEEFETTVYAV